MSLLEWDADVLPYPVRVCVRSGILCWHHLDVRNHPGHSFYFGGRGVGGCPAETDPLSFCLSPSARRSFSRSRLLRSSVTPVMDEFEHNLRPVCAAQDLLRSPASPFACTVIAHPRSGGNETKVFFCIKKKNNKKDLIKRSARPSGLSKCVLHPRGNTGTSHIEYSRSIWQTFGTRMQICSLFSSIPTELTHIHAWQWFTVLNEASERTSSSKKNLIYTFLSLITSMAA